MTIALIIITVICVCSLIWNVGSFILLYCIMDEWCDEKRLQRLSDYEGKKFEL